MLTIEIPNQIRDLVVTANQGEFPASCWATEIISNWLWDITQDAGYDDPEKCPMARAICKELGIEYDSFLQIGGDLFRAEAARLLARALGSTPDRPAFLKVSAMIFGSSMLSNDRKTIEIEWRDIVPEYRGHTFPLEGYLPMPVWQCLMRYYHEQWRNPIGQWHHDTLKWIRDNYHLISYPADQDVPFPATT